MLSDALSRFTRSKLTSLLLILFGSTLITKRLASAAPQSGNLDIRTRLIARDDYPSDYPYPKKDDCNAKVRTEADKSLYYTGLGKAGGKQIIDFKKQKSLHIVGDSFTYPSGFVVRSSRDILRFPEHPKKLGPYFDRICTDLSAA